MGLPRPCREIVLPGLACAILSAPAHAASTTVRCLYENGAIVVPAILDHAGGDWLIDVAEPHTLLHETRAQMEGIVEATTAGSLRVAGQRLDDLPVLVADLDPRAPGFVTPIVGAIGADVLGRYVVDIELSPCRLTLHAPAAAPPFAGQSLPLTLVEGRPTVRAAVADSHRALTGAFAIDTASRAAVRLAIPTAHGPNDGDPRQWSPTWIRALSIGGRLYEKPTAARGAELPPSLAGALGTDFLAAYRFRIDIPGGRLVLAPAKR